MMNNAEQGQMYGRLAVSFTEALQHDGDLGSDRLSLRVEGDRIDAADQAGAAGPLHGGDGPAAEPVSVGIGLSLIHIYRNIMKEKITVV